MNTTTIDTKTNGSAAPALDLSSTGRDLAIMIRRDEEEAIFSCPPELSAPFWTPELESYLQLVLHEDGAEEIIALRGMDARFLERLDDLAGIATPEQVTRALVICLHVVASASTDCDEGELADRIGAQIVAYLDGQLTPDELMRLMPAMPGGALGSAACCLASVAIGAADAEHTALSLVRHVAYQYGDEVTGLHARIIAAVLCDVVAKCEIALTEHEGGPDGEEWYPMLRSFLGVRAPA